MCGIVGFTHQGRPSTGERIREATATLLHGGPDQQGVFETPHVSPGAVRLKIIDLISGEQPMRSDDGDTVLVFNGEIYNFTEVREELKARGHRFSSRSDTEVVLRAFLEWDTGCFTRLRGLELRCGRNRAGAWCLPATAWESPFGSEINVCALAGIIKWLVAGKMARIV